MEKFYIAYGSNLNLGQMVFRCKGAKIVGTSEIKDYQLLFKGSKTGSYLTIEKCEGKSVPVVVWKVNEFHEMALDRYEGYPTFYYKKEMVLEVKGIKSRVKRRLKGFVYIMHEDRKIGMPYKGYVEACLEGYKAFRFNPKYLQEALQISMEARDEHDCK
ncbi:MAG: gamma-glutamylcyclotransferase family protein [Christensenellales bacterium]|jgi:hypothetical protein